jgi:acetyltransferase-like isoleucine patch superfamily enzyme
MPVRDCIIGLQTKIMEPVNLYECTLGESCFVGPFVEIQKGVVIGSFTKIQSHSFVCELVSIGEQCFIGHGVMFINDTVSSGAPSRGNKKLWKSTKIGNNVYIGSNATILPVEISSNVVIGAGSVVTRSINKPGIYAGNPAKKIRDLL